MDHIGLSQDDFLAFFSELDNDWIVKSTPTMVPGQLQDKIPRRSRRVDLVNARKEISELQNQLKTMHDNLNRRGTTRIFSHWQTYILTEKVLKLRADEENSRLRKRIKETINLSRRIVSLANQQAEIASELMQISRPIANGDVHKDAQIFHGLQACIDLRCRSNLAKIVQQCYAQSAVSIDSLEREEWHEFTLGGRSVLVDFQEAIAVPFSSASIFNSMRRYAAVNAVESKVTKTHPKVSSRANSNMKSERQLIVRRIATVRREHILLWEDAAQWQSNAMPASVFVRSSGWSFVCPVANHSDQLSLVWMGCRIQICSANGSTLKPSDAHVRSIITNMHLQQRSRVACMEAAVLAAKPN